MLRVESFIDAPAHVVLKVLGVVLAKVGIVVFPGLIDIASPEITPVLEDVFRHGDTSVFGPGANDGSIDGTD